MDEKKKNRAYFLLDCLENNGQITINREDMLNILKLNREITIDEFVVRLKQSLLYTSDENGWEGYTVEEKQIDEAAKQIKGDKE